MERKRVAIIGSGIAGLSAARQIHPFDDIAIFEKAPTWGGHAYTHATEIDGKPYLFDIGVQIFRTDIYPHLIRFCQDADFADLALLGLGVSLLSVHEQNGARKVWGNTPEYLRLPEIKSLWDSQLCEECSRFMIAMSKLDEDDQMLILDDWLKANNFSDLFKNVVLIPSLSIVNVTRNGLLDGTFLTTLELPDILISFFSANTWYRFREGIRSFLEIYSRDFQDKISTDSQVLKCIPQTSGQVKLTIENLKSKEIYDLQFDQVLFANDLTDARQILDHEENPHREKQQSLLRVFKSENAFIYVHRDSSILPTGVPLTSSTLFHHRDGESVMHYNLDANQGNYGQTNAFASLYSEKPTCEPTELLRDMVQWKHPNYSPNYFAAQRQLHQLQGLGNLWFCGNNTVIDGFEASMVSGLIIAEKMCRRAVYPFHEPKNLLEGRASEVYKMVRSRWMFPEEELA
ncbi:MAG: NAD(P)-binding protein [Candidatus Latescibacteria bacterium]|nr:NAD(P)-binding protein [Candidatus Latescibacterota bacterium]